MRKRAQAALFFLLHSRESKVTQGREATLLGRARPGAGAALGSEAWVPAGVSVRASTRTGRRLIGGALGPRLCQASGTVSRALVYVQPARTVHPSESRCPAPAAALPGARPPAPVCGGGAGRGGASSPLGCARSVGSCPKSTHWRSGRP